MLKSVSKALHVRGASGTTLGCRKSPPRILGLSPKSLTKPLPAQVYVPLIGVVFSGSACIEVHTFFINTEKLGLGLGFLQA